ncbi:MAG: hypothetical protein HYZ53_02745 [Planctomycetes bacterium]|nr:hypothetical protein [Planctomycetota bacterium]
MNVRNGILGAAGAAALVVAGAAAWYGLPAPAHPPAAEVAAAPPAAPAAPPAPVGQTEKSRPARVVKSPSLGATAPPGGAKSGGAGDDGAAAGDAGSGAGGRVPTIDEGPEDKPHTPGGVTFAPSDKPRDLPPDGSTSEIHYPFKTPAEAQAWEEMQKKQFEERLAKRREASAAALGKELDLDEGQSVRLKAVLEGEATRRSELVNALTDRRVSDLEFQKQVVEIRTEARKQLVALLHPDQLAKYNALPPKKQIFQEHAQSGH